jgi:hypothetical protein
MCVCACVYGAQGGRQGSVRGVGAARVRAYTLYVCVHACVCVVKGLLLAQRLLERDGQPALRTHVQGDPGVRACVHSCVRVRVRDAGGQAGKRAWCRRCACVCVRACV